MIPPTQLPPRWARRAWRGVSVGFALVVSGLGVAALLRAIVLTLHGAAGAGDWTAAAILAASATIFVINAREVRRVTDLLERWSRRRAE